MLSKIVYSAVFVLILLLGAGFYFFDGHVPFLPVIGEALHETVKMPPEEVLERIAEIRVPPPLRQTQKPLRLESVLTASGVWSATNAERVKVGLPPLTRNNALDRAASAKVEDMFLRQYFAHDAPGGTGAGDLAKSAGYEFIAIGENLALGNFDNDGDLVQGWMNSPGHRANILNTRYQEIGLAVKRGLFEGKTTWLAVQEFGLPLSACPASDDALAAKIERYKQELKRIEVLLDEKNAQLEAARPRRGSEYNQKVDEYNSLVELHNNLVDEIKRRVGEYNEGVREFNACAQVKGVAKSPLFLYARTRLFSWSKF